MRQGKKDMQRLRQAIYVFFILGIGLGAWAVVLAVRHPKTGPPKGTNVAQPLAVKPTKALVDAYTVAPDIPKYITIPAAKVPATRVRQLGLGKDNQIAVPDNIYDAGWYKASAKPGQAGAMFIYGHVSSWQANGIFYNLHKLKTGDLVTITRGDNTTFTYRVITTKVYPHDNVDMHEVLAPAPGVTAGLNLMTCAGHVIKGTSEFDQRLVVFTSLVH